MVSVVLGGGSGYFVVQVVLDAVVLSWFVVRSDVRGRTTGAAIEIVSVVAPRARGDRLRRRAAGAWKPRRSAGGEGGLLLVDLVLTRRARGVSYTQRHSCRAIASDCDECVDENGSIRLIDGFMDSWYLGDGCEPQHAHEPEHADQPERAEDVAADERRGELHEGRRRRRPSTRAHHTRAQPNERRRERWI